MVAWHLDITHYRLTDGREVEIIALRQPSSGDRSALEPIDESDRCLAGHSGPCGRCGVESEPGV